MITNISKEIKYSHIGYDGTLDKKYLHKNNVNEVFLTGFMQVNGADFVAAAQLPKYHHHYTDTITCRGLINPLLVLECARQAETYAVHKMYGADIGTHFILKKWSMDIDMENAKRFDRAIAVELNSLIKGTTAHTRFYKDSLRHNEYGFTVELNTLPIAKIRMEVEYLPSNIYAKLRQNKRSGLQVVHEEEHQGEKILPYMVGHQTMDNVIVANFKADGDQCSAQVDISNTNTSYVDHPQDHYTAMTLMEAARQFILIYLFKLEKIDIERVAVKRLISSFHEYAELDVPLIVRLDSVDKTASGYLAQMSFMQNETKLATAEYEIVTLDDMRV